jgi:hypothetical protein
MNQQASPNRSPGYLAAAAVVLVGSAVPTLLGLMSANGAGWVRPAIPLVGLVMIPTCFGELARRDRPRFVVSVVPPAIAYVIYIALLPLGERPTWLGNAATGWLIAWLFAGSWLWVRFSRAVLRREPNAEYEFGERWRNFRILLAKHADYQTLWAAITEMRRGETDRMRPLIDTWFFALDAPGTDDRGERMQRAMDRQDELLTRYNRDSWAPNGPWPNPSRPTEGTLLELGYPELEAIVAVATPQEQRRIVAAASRFALREADVLDARTEAAIDRAADGEIDRTVEAELEAAIAADEPAMGFDIPDEGSPEYARDREARRRTIARQVAGYAFESELDATDVALAVYGAARTCDSEQLERLRVALAAVVAPERLAGASPVAVDHAALEASRRERARDAGPLPRAMRPATAAAIGFASGIVSALAPIGVTNLVGSGDSVTSALRLSVGLLALVGSAWVLLVLTKARPGPVSTMTLLMLASAVVIGESIAKGWLDWLLARLAPGFYVTVFEHRTSALPYVPLHGLVGALVFAVTAWFWWRGARAVDRARARAELASQAAET